MAVDQGSLTVCTSDCNMWYSYIDRLKVESNKGKKKKRVNTISERCLSIIHCLVTNYLNDGKNVGSHASWPRKRAQKNPPSLLPKSVFIESFMNGVGRSDTDKGRTLKESHTYGRETSHQNATSKSQPNNKQDSL
jgi:hypothetical protein